MSIQQHKNRQVAIIGNGAIGNLLAFRCRLLGLDYGVVSRNEQKIEIDVIDSNDEKVSFALPITPLKSIDQFKVILLAVKAYQVEPFITQAQALIQPWQTLVLLHNGMGTIELVQKKLPTINVVAATTTYGAFKPDTNQLAIKGKGETQLGWIQHPTANTNEIEELLSALLPPSTWHQDIRLALWRKLAINAVINPLTALYNIKNGELAQPGYQRQISALCDEISHIMQQLGFDLKTDDLLTAITRVIQQTGANYSSMNRDINAQRITEIDYINGYILKQAAKLGLSCPNNLALLNEIKQREIYF